MPNFDAVIDHAKDFIEGKVEEPHIIENTETCTCRFQSCCYVSWSKFYIELWWEVFASSQLLKEWKLFWWKSKTEDDSQYYTGDQAMNSLQWRNSLQWKFIAMKSMQWKQWNTFIKIHNFLLEIGNFVKKLH